MNLNKNVSKLKLGMKVTSDFHSNEKDVVRTLTMIKEDSSCGSGFRASADAGEPCPCCGLSKGTSILSVDAPWFIPV